MSSKDESVLGPTKIAEVQPDDNAWDDGFGKTKKTKNSVQSRPVSKPEKVKSPEKPKMLKDDESSQLLNKIIQDEQANPNASKAQE